MRTNDCIRVFIDAHVFDGEYQGTRTFIKEIYAILAGKPGIQLFLAASNIDNLKADFPDNGNVHFLKYKNSSSYLRLLYDIPLLIKKHDIHYAHFQYVAPLTKACRYIVTIHDVLFSEYPEEFSLKYRLTKKILFKRSALKANIVTTVSEYSKKSIAKFLGLKSDNIYVVPNGVNALFFEPYDKQQAKDFITKKFGIQNFILFVSRFEPRKNHLTLLNAYLDLKLYTKGYHLVLLGHTSINVPGFNEVLTSLPEEIRKFIFISSAIRNEDLLQFYRAATLFVYPSKAEGFGIPPLEAGALKVPVICSNTSAMGEFSFFGENHIDPLNYDLFKKKLSEIITHPADESYLNAVSAEIREKYSWTHAADTLYQLIINDHKQATAKDNP